MIVHAMRTNKYDCLIIRRKKTFTKKIIERFIAKHDHWNKMIK